MVARRRINSQVVVASAAVTVARCVLSNVLAVKRPQTVVKSDFVADAWLARALLLRRSNIFVKRCVSTSFAATFDGTGLTMLLSWSCNSPLFQGSGQILYEMSQTDVVFFR